MHSCENSDMEALLLCCISKFDNALRVCVCVSSVHRLIIAWPPCVYIMQVFQECQARDASGKSFELTMVGCKCIVAYVKNKKNQNQVTNYFLY